MSAALPTSPLPPWCGFAAEPVCLEGAPVSPAELALLSPQAVEKRRREFLSGRRAARRALVAAGAPEPSPVLKGPRGEPLWPVGFVGAITHSSTVAAAAVAPASRARAVGLDVENLDVRVGADVARYICLPEEEAWVGAGGDADARLRLVFSAKETIFKALYPLGRVELDFKDAHVAWREAAQGFEATLLRRASPDHPAGFTFSVGARREGALVMTFALLT
jgi:4'-phosphopantetheinyl transferase EntD